MTFKIETEVPIPEPKHENSGLTETLRKMNVGDSIVLTAAQVLSLTRIAKDAGVKITRRRESENEFRVWKTGLEENDD